MSYFLHTCKCTMHHTFFYDEQFYFPLRLLISIQAWAHLSCDYQGKESPPRFFYKCPPLKVVFHQRSSSTKESRLSTEDHLTEKVIFHKRLSSTIGRLPTKDIFHQRSSSTYHKPRVDLIFVRAVNIRMHDA